MTPTKAALAYFRRQGFEPYVTQKFIRAPGRSFYQDAYGFGDILIYHAEKKITALVQACIRTDMANRRTKILNNPKAPGWVKAGNKIYLAALAKRKRRGSKRIKYELVFEDVSEKYSYHFQG